MSDRRPPSERPPEEKRKVGVLQHVANIGLAPLYLGHHFEALTLHDVTEAIHGDDDWCWQLEWGLYRVSSPSSLPLLAQASASQLLKKGDE